ncbi:Uroporphyrinogen decarboxylase, partial [Clarias magur]
DTGDICGVVRTGQVTAVTHTLCPDSGPGLQSHLVSLIHPCGFHIHVFYMSARNNNV